MKKSTNLGPIRISPEDKKTIDKAVDKAGVSLASKARELVLAWARGVLK